MKGSEAEDELQKLKSTATELLLREDWNSYINLYSHFISRFLPQFPNEEGDPKGTFKLRRAICCALSNRAEARYRLRDLCAALDDCNRALQLHPDHLKSLVCKGKLLLDLHCYSESSSCFRRAVAVSASNCPGDLSQLLRRSRKLEAQSKTGSIDLSDWFLNGYEGRCPELAEYIGNVEIRPSETGGGRGLFATRSVEAGTPLVITKAVALVTGILPKAAEVGDDDTARMVMWKAFVDKILDAAEKCSKTLSLLYTLSAGDPEGRDQAVPKMELFRPAIGAQKSFEKLDVERILRVLDVNCLTEESVSAKVMGKKKKGSCGVGLWFLPSMVNHSCCPNARRLHIGDWVVVHASRDIKDGEEITFAYLDVLRPLNERKEMMAKRWGFFCCCERCLFEEGRKKELGELAAAMYDAANAVVAGIEDRVRKWDLKGKEKGFLRASFWVAYSKVLDSDRLMMKRGGGGRMAPDIPAAVARSILVAVGGDERVIKILLRRFKNVMGFGHGIEPVEMERLMRLARGVYGKVMKSQHAMKTFFDHELVSSMP